MFTAAHQSQMSPPGLNHEASQAARVQKLKHQSCTHSTASMHMHAARDIRFCFIHCLHDLPTSCI